MCHNYAKHFSFLIILLFSGYWSFGQNSNRENAPYSRYGVGELRNGVNTQLRGMASASTAYASAFSINSDNPASYSYLKLTTYEAAFEGSFRTVKANGNSYGTGMATLAYLNVGFPLGKNAGMNLGLRPYSRVFYQMNDTADVIGMGKTVRGYSGDGGLNYAFIGAAGKIKDFSIGANIGYMFGTIRNSSVLQRLDDTNSYNADFSRYTKIGGIYYKLGLMYDARLKKDLHMRIGATAALQQNLNGWRDDYAVSFRSTSGTTIFDTAQNSQNVRGKVNLPLALSFGVQVFGNDKWSTGLDFTSTNWKQYRNYGSSDSIADNAFKVAVGGEYTPNPASLYRYLPRVTYRLGFYYGSDYVKLRNTTINYYAVTVGASLPFKRSADRIHTSIELGKRGTETKGLIKENFIKFSLGISLNDRWFIKRRYE